MNNFDKQLELSTTKPASSPLWSRSKDRTRRWIENDSAIVVFLIISGLLGLYYIPKTPFADAAPSSITGAFSPAVSDQNIFSSSAHPSTAHTLISGPLEVGSPIQFSVPTAQNDWSYFLTIGDAAPIPIKAPFSSYTFTEAGVYSLELTAKRQGQFELLEVRNIIIAPSMMPTTASSQQKLTPF
ncbi:MAG: hypothetical protein AAGG75_19055 [Bacteroidota bacterium]